MWHGVALADFDGDGRPDIAASNAGRNTAYELYPKPVRLFYGDADGDGVMELSEGFADTGTKLWKPIRKLDVFARTFPQVRVRCLITPKDHRPGVSRHEIDRNPHPVERGFLNKHGRFEMRALQDAAQFSPAFGLCSEDLDGDGLTDLFLAQNDFRPGAARVRTATGVCCCAAVARAISLPCRLPESSIVLHGEQRGVVAADFNEDGQPDLAVSQ